MRKLLNLSVGLALSAAMASTGCTISSGDDDEDPDGVAADGGADDDMADDDIGDDDMADAGADDDDIGDDDIADDDIGDDDIGDDDMADAGADDDLMGDAGADDDAMEPMDGGMDPEPEGDAEAPEPDPTPDVTLIDCGDRDPTDADIVVDAAINDDTTWSGLVYLDGATDVGDGVTLTIEAGTRIIAAVDSDLQLGFAGGATTIVAEGTAEEPITFCGEDEDAGFWRGIQVDQNVTSNSVMSNVLIADAGGNGAGLRLSADITIDNVQVRNSADDGVYATDFQDDSTRLTVTGAEGNAVVLDGAGAVTNFPLGGLFQDNAENVAVVDFSSINEDTVFHDLGIPYRQASDVDVGEAEVVFEAGIEYQVQADADIQFGFAGAATLVNVEGTASNPVVFRGVAEEAGFWQGLQIDANVLTASSFSNMEIHHAGSGNYALIVSARVTLDGVSLSDNASGVFIDAQGLDPDSVNLSVTGTESVPLTVDPEAVITIPRGGDFSGNDIDRIVVEGGGYNVEGTVANLGVPYLVESNIDVGDGASMTIEPGVHFIMSADTDIQFGFAGGEVEVVAEGTEEEPIRFTGSDEVPGSWTGLLIEANVSSSSSFNWVEIGHAGGNGAALRLSRPLSVTNSTFFDSAGFGILKTAADTNDYTESNTFTNNASGDVDDI